jgi:hypothetical protein
MDRRIAWCGVPKNFKLTLVPLLPVSTVLLLDSFVCSVFSYGYCQIDLAQQ